MTTPTTRAPVTPEARREGFLLGAAIGAALARSTADCPDADAVRHRLGAGLAVAPRWIEDGKSPAALGTADALLEELLGGGVDLHQLAHRWVEWYTMDGTEVDPRLGAALDHLRQFDAPLDELPGSGPLPMAAALPAGLTGAAP